MHVNQGIADRPHNTTQGMELIMAVIKDERDASCLLASALDEDLVFKEQVKQISKFPSEVHHQERLGTAGVIDILINDRPVGLEVKGSAPVDPAQLRRYGPETANLALVVPDGASESTRAILKAAELDVPVITWEQVIKLMCQRKRLNIHSRQLTEWVSQLELGRHDVTAELWRAWADSAVPDGMKLYVESNATGLPALNLSGPGVLAQVQAPKTGKFVATVGFTEQDLKRLAKLLGAAARSEAAENAVESMGVPADGHSEGASFSSVCTEGGYSAPDAHTAPSVQISTHVTTVKRAGLDHVPGHYKKGYAGDYIGVTTTPTRDAKLAVGAMIAAATAFAKIDAETPRTATAHAAAEGTPPLTEAGAT